MTSAEIALVAALGASLLTGFASLGVTWIREWLRGRASERDALRTSVQELLSRSMAVAMRASTVGETMRIRSGLKEGFDVAMRHRKLVDGLELHDWMAQDLAPLNAALSDIWTRDNEEGVRLANEVVSKCMDLLGASTARQQVNGSLERMRRWAMGEKWTPEMLAEYNRAIGELAEARKRFAEHARARFGLDAVGLFYAGGSGGQELRRPNRWTAIPGRLPSRVDRAGVLPLPGPTPWRTLRLTPDTRRRSGGAVAKRNADDESCVPLSSRPVSRSSFSSMDSSVSRIAICRTT